MMIVLIIVTEKVLDPVIRFGYQVDRFAWKYGSPVHVELSLWT